VETQGDCGHKLTHRPSLKPQNRVSLFVPALYERAFSDLDHNWLKLQNYSVGRIKEFIKVDGIECWTLFNTGARNTYVIPSVAKVLTTTRMSHPFHTALGGEVRETSTSAILQAEVEGHLIATHAMVIDEIGDDEDGRPIEILFGALAMQQWGIRPVPGEERLDLTHYPKEFVEF
jgi:hypothetical protein